jgi:hypothetical protein
MSATLFLFALDYRHEIVLLPLFSSPTNALFLFFPPNFLNTDPTGKEGVKAKLADLVEIMQPKADVPIQAPQAPRRF